MVYYIVVENITNRIIRKSIAKNEQSIVSDNLNSAIIISNQMFSDIKLPAIATISDGQLVSYSNIEKVVTIQDIDNETVNKIRERYNENEESKMLRLGIVDNTNQEFINYNNYVESCRQEGISKKQRLGLI